MSKKVVILHMEYGCWMNCNRFYWALKTYFIAIDLCRNLSISLIAHRKLNREMRVPLVVQVNFLFFSSFTNQLNITFSIICIKT